MKNESKTVRGETNKIRGGESRNGSKTELVRGTSENKTEIGKGIRGRVICF